MAPCSFQWFSLLIFLLSPQAQQLTLTSELCNGAQLRLVYTRYSGFETFEFAGEQVSVEPGSNKLTCTVSNWPFHAPENQLRVQTEIEILQQQPIVAERFYDWPERPFIWEIEVSFLCLSLYQNTT